MGFLAVEELIMKQGLSRAGGRSTTLTELVEAQRFVLDLNVFVQDQNQNALNIP